MREIDVGVLCCIFQDEPSHSADAGIRVVVTGNSDVQLLTCVGCPATYLMKSGIPHMLHDQELDGQDSRTLKRLRRQYEKGMNRR
jgi:uncharacterized protein YbaR (Trm112 family)